MIDRENHLEIHDPFRNTDVLKNIRGVLYVQDYNNSRWYALDIENNIRRVNPRPKSHERRAYSLITNYGYFPLYRHFTGTWIFGVEIECIGLKYYWKVGEYKTDQEIMRNSIAKARMLGSEEEYMYFEGYQHKLRAIGRSVCGENFRSAIKDL